MAIWKKYTTGNGVGFHRYSRCVISGERIIFELMVNCITKDQYYWEIIHPRKGLRRKGYARSLKEAKGECMAELINVVESEMMFSDRNL